MCAAPLEGTLPRTEQRWIFVDLKDLHLPGYLAGAGGYAEVAAHIYERFVPFADDGWEPTTLPGDPAFDLWVYEHVQGELRIIGVNLLSRRSGPQRV